MGQTHASWLAEPHNARTKRSRLSYFLSALLLFLALLCLFHQLPVPSPLFLVSPASAPLFDLQGHRGARGLAPESTLFAFAAGLKAGVTTLELDVTLAADGTPFVWHDERALDSKCSGDAVGKRLEDLTYAEIKALDCGKTLPEFPRQVAHPGARIQTLDQVLQFGLCVAPKGGLQWNVESKVQPPGYNSTFSAEKYTQVILDTLKRHDVIDRVIFQSFYWRTLHLSKLSTPSLCTSALIAPFIHTLPADKASLWLDGHTLDAQPGNTTSLRVAQAAASLGADIVSPLHGAPGESGDAAYVPFTDAQMTHEAHRLGVHVLPWTVNAVLTADRMHDVGAEGIITDFPDEMHAWAVEKGVRVPPRRSERRVEKCLREALARDRP